MRILHGHVLTAPLHIVAVQVRATQVPPDMCNDPSSVTGEALVSLLDMSVQGKSLGIDPQSGEPLPLMHLMCLCL